MLAGQTWDFAIFANERYTFLSSILERLCAENKGCYMLELDTVHLPSSGKRSVLIIELLGMLY